MIITEVCSGFHGPLFVSDLVRSLVSGRGKGGGGNLVVVTSRHVLRKTSPSSPPLISCCGARGLPRMRQSRRRKTTGVENDKVRVVLRGARRERETGSERESPVEVWCRRTQEGTESGGPGVPTESPSRFPSNKSHKMGTRRTRTSRHHTDNEQPRHFGVTPLLYRTGHVTIPWRPNDETSTSSGRGVRAALGGGSSFPRRVLGSFAVQRPSSPVSVPGLQ